MRALGGERARDRAADAARGAGHQRDPALERGPSAPPRRRAERRSVALERLGSLDVQHARALARSSGRARPARCPGPTSTKVVTPSRTSRSTDSCQRTGADTWRTSPSRHAAPVAHHRGVDVVHERRLAGRGTAGPRGPGPAAPAPAASARSGRARTPAAARPASRPRLAQRSSARSTAPGVARDHDLARRVDVRGRRRPRPAAASRHAASTAASVEAEDRGHRARPTGTASCMYWPRRRTVRTASASESAPAATSAEYSPRLWPATQSGRTPRATSGAQRGDARGQDRGLRVRGELQLGLGPLEAQPREREAEGRVGLVEDLAALREGLGSARPIPTCCEPWPGKTNATLMRVAASACALGRAPSAAARSRSRR